MVFAVFTFGCHYRCSCLIKWNSSKVRSKTTTSYIEDEVCIWQSLPSFFYLTRTAHDPYFFFKMSLRYFYYNWDMKFLCFEVPWPKLEMCISTHRRITLVPWATISFASLVISLHKSPLHIARLHHVLTHNSVHTCLLAKAVI